MDSQELEHELYENLCLGCLDEVSVESLGCLSLFNYLSQIGTPNLLFLMDTSVPQGSDEISILSIFQKRMGYNFQLCYANLFISVIPNVLSSHDSNSNYQISYCQMCPKYLVSAVSDGSSFIWGTLGVGTGDLLYFDSFNI